MDKTNYEKHNLGNFMDVKSNKYVGMYVLMLGEPTINEENQEVYDKWRDLDSNESYRIPDLIEKSDDNIDIKIFIPHVDDVIDIGLSYIPGTISKGLLTPGYIFSPNEYGKDIIVRQLVNEDYGQKDWKLWVQWEFRDANTIYQIDNDDYRYLVFSKQSMSDIEDIPFILMYDVDHVFLPAK